MNILVIGSGGREHAICSAFARSGHVTKVFCASGNAGIAEIAECVDIMPEQIDQLAAFAHANAIDLTFVGGEVPLALGIADKFESSGLPVIGARKQAARLEASKSFAKDFMLRHRIPTARYKTANSTMEAIEFLRSGEFGGENARVVIKADGLAAGKGVVVAENRADAIVAIHEMPGRVGIDSAEKVVLEECLFGREVSLLMFADGVDFALMPPTRDHKRIGEGDTGPNTGGMGTFTDSSLLTDQQTGQIIREIIQPTLKGCVDEGFPFRGILFLGLMLTDPARNATDMEWVPSKGPKLLEYNVRFGDPETQSILVRLKTDIVEICEAMLAGTLDKTPISWHEGNSATIVLATKGYPVKPSTGDIIYGIKNAQLHDDISIFHAGTSKNDDELVTSGGRVLGVTAIADNLPEALENAYKAVNDIFWEGLQYRKDIGQS